MLNIRRTILLSVISLLNEPNTYSPANVDASVMYRRWKDSKGKDAEYANIIKKQVEHPQMSLHDNRLMTPLRFRWPVLAQKPKRITWWCH